jgi:predicted nucleotidyltransferase
MRLSTDQIQAIRDAATAAFGQGTSVWLFGSRVDDSKKGGDIDLLVSPVPKTGLADELPKQGFMQKIKMLTILEQRIGERKVDVIVEHPQDDRPIVAIAYRTGIKLQ